MQSTLSLDGTRGPIVMVDDEELDIEAVSRALRKSKLEREFLSFPDGPPFLEYLESVKAGKADHPSLVLLDINMPLMSGFAVLREMRSDPTFRETPVVSMLSSSERETDKEKALGIGANEYLVKPGDYNLYTEFFDSIAG